MDSRASSLRSMTMTVSHPATSSAGEIACFAPAWTNGLVLAASRFQTVTSRPTLRSRCASALPIRPVPQTPIFIGFILTRVRIDGGFYAFGRQRQVARTHAKRMCDRVSDRCRDGAGRAFAGAQGGLARRFDDGGVNARNLREFHDRIIFPGADREAPVGPASLLHQRPARGLDDAAFDLVEDAVAMNHLACIDRAVDLPEVNSIGDLHGRNGGVIRADVLVAAKSEAASATFSAWIGGVPVRELGSFPDHGNGARVVQMTEPEFDGIDLCERRQFVHERLDGENVAVGAERAERGTPQWTLWQEMMRNPAIANFVDRHRIAVSAAVRPRCVVRWPRIMGLRQALRREQLHTGAEAGARKVRRAPDRVPPFDDCSGLVERALELHPHGRAERGPAQFVGARPETHHGSTCLA